MTVAPVAAVTDLATVDDQLEQHARTIERVQRDAVFEIGRELAAAQELFYNRRNDGFQAWMAKRLPHLAHTTAYRAIEIFKGISDPATYTNLVQVAPSTSALAEVAKAEPDIQSLIAEKIAAGEVFTAASVKALREERDNIVAKLDKVDQKHVAAMDAAQKKAQKRLQKEMDAREQDAETIATLRKELDDIQNDPVMEALRKSVEDAVTDTAAKGKKKKGGQNPVYKPNPALELTLSVIGPVRALSERLPTIDPDRILAGFVDDFDRNHGLNAVRICRDYFNQLLEKGYAEKTA